MCDASRSPTKKLGGSLQCPTLVEELVGTERCAQEIPNRMVNLTEQTPNETGPGMCSKEAGSKSFEPKIL